MTTLKRLAIAFLSCTCMLYQQHAAADISLDKYAEFRKSVPQFTDYLVGVGRGIFWANVVLQVHGKPKLFCMPENLALDEGIILSILDQEIRKPIAGKPYGKDATVEMVMAFAFARRFPCSQ